MKLEPTTSGSWLATGCYCQRRYVAEGKTREEARQEALLLIAERKHEAEAAQHAA